MSRAHKALQARRERLIARAEEQRQEIAEEVGALHAMAERAQSRLIGLKRIAPLLGIGSRRRRAGDDARARLDASRARRLQDLAIRPAVALIVGADRERTDSDWRRVNAPS